MQFDWTPYYNPLIIQNTPQWIYTEAEIWPSVTALICFATVEWHQVDRVLRQLGGHQHIPNEPLNIDRLHAVDGQATTMSGGQIIIGTFTLCGRRDMVG